ncbi:Uncharacterised protein [Candidatus Venteria ishoeyi]|uniref:DUF3037 domain-containing protein n=2 Tax=Candidatus Venteria ishoeyi TaxID=1899563 RepID=A0A1H6FE38_9GAMM|nr:Uncharacterised protein [Candidatus Venteria ishoeyi]
MNQFPCQYAIARFMPFIETGEFANIGIVLLVPQQKRITFKLITRRYARVTNFFHDLDANVYHTARNVLKDELVRLQGFLHDKNAEAAEMLFHELVRPRETVLRFSKPRVVLADNIDKKLDDLFGFYVEHNFATKQYQEHILEKTLRGWLTESGINKQFKREKVGDPDYAAPFPFVESKYQKPEKIIKPLYLGHEELTQLVDHGGLWTIRINQLQARGALPHKVLFTIEGGTATPGHEKECLRVAGELKSNGIKVLPHDAKTDIMNFAKSAA